MIGIVILNYNNWEDTEKCISSIKKTTRDLHYRIYLIDNSSTKRIPGNFKKQIDLNENVIFVENKENKGYSAGNNVGIKLALEENCEAILIANNDIIFHKDSIKNLFSYLKADSTIGIVGPKIFNLDGSIHIPAMLIKTGIKEKYMVNTFLRKLNGKKQQSYYCKKENLNKIFETHAVSGCCFMLSKECAEKITPLDENTFLFEEELIVGINMEKEALRTVYYPLSTITHAHGQSTKNVKAFSYICKVESELYYMKKYLNANKFEILPFYLIRTLGFFSKTLKHKDFRKNTLKYFSKSYDMIFSKF